VFQELVPTSKVVVAEEAPGVRVRTVSGTFTVMGTPCTAKVMVWLTTRTVAGVAPTPDTLATLLNQI
jgi:hypothetical protein